MEYWLVTTGPEGTPGIDGGIGRREDAADQTITTVDVAPVDEFTAKITAAGGKVISPKMAIPGIGWFAVCLDTVGNKFGLMESESNAK